MLSLKHKYSNGDGEQTQSQIGFHFPQYNTSKNGDRRFNRSTIGEFSNLEQSFSRTKLVREHRSSASCEKNKLIVNRVRETPNNQKFRLNSSMHQGGYKSRKISVLGLPDDSRKSSISTKTTKLTVPSEMMFSTLSNIETQASTVFKTPNNRINKSVFLQTETDQIEHSKDWTIKESQNRKIAARLITEIEDNIQSHKMEMFDVIQLSLEQFANSDPIYSKLVLLIKKTLDQIMSSKNTTINKLASDNSLVKEKRRAANLEKENIELTKEYEKQLRLIESHQQIIKELNNKVSDKNLNRANNFQSAKLMDEMKMLYKENTRLNAINNKLQFEISQLRTREISLMKLLKNETTLKENSIGFFKEIDINEKQIETKKEFSSTVIENKKRVEVPALDFSKLPGRKPAKFTVIPCSSHSSSISETSEENYFVPSLY